MPSQQHVSDSVSKPSEYVAATTKPPGKDRENSIKVGCSSFPQTLRLSGTSKYV